MSRPRSLSLALLLWALPATAGAADWHVAPGGADGADGSEQAPLATLAHALTRAGGTDRILLKRGGTYRLAAALDFGGSLTVGAYGTGEDPVITASAVVDLPGTWAANPAVRTGPVASPVLACYVDGRFVPLARYPNTGFLRVDNDDSPDQIVDAELASRPGVAAGRWTGAQVRWRRWSWWWETRPIAGHDPVTTLSLGADGRFQDPFSDPGSGYFIDNSLAELDAPGEWYWGDGTLYLYPPAWADPSTMVVEVVTGTDGTSTSGTRLSGVAFKRFGGTALKLTRPATVDGCTFADLETNAVEYTWDSQPFVIKGSVFRDVHNVAISGWANAAGPSGSLIERNLFQRIGVQWGYGGSGSWHAAGIILGNASAATVQLNRFVDLGYAGIILGSDGQTVQRNVFVRAMESLNDGAAIYTNCNASNLRENIILDTVGNLETSHPWWPLGHGIWPEFLSDFHDTQIVDNTLYGSNGSGLFLPNNFTCTVTGNVCLDGRVSGLDLEGDSGDDQGHTLSGNTLAAVVPTRRVPRNENLNQWWLPPYAEPTPVALQFQRGVDYGSMSETTFIAPAAGASVMRQSDVGDYDTLADWTAAALSWASDSGSRVVRANAILLFNDTESAAEMAVPEGRWTLPDGSAVGATVSVAAFHSAVLVTSDPVPAAPPYYAASGIDWRAEVPVTGVLTATPEIAVSRGTASIASGGTDAVAGTAAGAARELTYAIANQGSVALTLGAVGLSAQANCTATVSTQPSATVAGAAIDSGGTDAVSGTAVGVAMALTYVLSNGGSGPLAVTTPIAPTAATNCTAAVTAQPAGTVEAQASTELVVTVTPSAAGAWSFQLAVASDDPGQGSYAWTVSGAAGEVSSPDAGAAGADGGSASAPDAGAGDVASGCGCGAGTGGAPLLGLVALAALGCRRRRP